MKFLKNYQDACTQLDSIFCQISQKLTSHVPEKPKSAIILLLFLCLLLLLFSDYNLLHLLWTCQGIFLRPKYIQIGWGKKLNLRVNSDL